MGRSPVATLVAVIGVIFVIVAIVYWLVPAGSLPGVMPGFEAGSTQVHVKHGIAALVIGIVLIVASRFLGRGRSAV
jgi:ammonia channel protein AmtB